MLTPGLAVHLPLGSSPSPDAPEPAGPSGRQMQRTGSLGQARDPAHLIPELFHSLPQVQTAGRTT